MSNSLSAERIYKLFESQWYRLENGYAAPLGISRKFKNYFYDLWKSPPKGLSFILLLKMIYFILLYLLCSVFEYKIVITVLFKGTHKFYMRVIFILYFGLLIKRKFYVSRKHYTIIIVCTVFCNHFHIWNLLLNFMKLIYIRLSK